MHRAGVRPWSATVLASLFVLFGAGAANILWAFQISFVGSVAFGLTHLLLADHDGPFDRRDWLGLLAGFATLLCPTQCRWDSSTCCGGPRSPAPATTSLAKRTQRRLVGSSDPHRHVIRV